MERQPADKASKSYVRAYKAVRFASALTGRMITSIGIGNLPREGAYILAYSHHNSWDIPALGAEVYEHCARPIYFMAREELLDESRITGRTLRSMHALPVNRDNALKLSQIREPIKLLQEGHILGIAPEGRRVDGNKIAELKRGVGLIATKANAQVVPVGIAGRNLRTKRRTLSFLPRSLHLHFGEPILVDREPSQQKTIENRLPGALQQALNAAYQEYNEIHGKNAAAKLDYGLDSIEETL